MLYILNQQIYTLKLNIKPQQIVGLRPHGQQFLEAPMVDEQWEVFEEIMQEGAAELADVHEQLGLASPRGSKR